MAGTLSVQKIQGLATSATPTTVEISSGHKLTGAAGSIVAPGQTEQIVKAEYTYSDKIDVNSTSYIDAVSINFTPKFNNSIIRIDVQSVWWLHTSPSSEEYFITTVYRDSTNIGSSNSNRVNQFRSGYVDSGNAYNYNNGFTIFTFDTPNTTSQVTYKLYVHSGGGNEVRFGDQNSENTITAMEIAQ